MGQSESIITKIAAHRIRELRKEKGLTIDNLAEKSGLSTQTIKTIEAGKRNFRLETLVALSDSLGVSCDYIVGKEDKSHESRIQIILSSLGDKDLLYLLPFLEQYASLLTQIREESNHDIDSHL